MKTIVDPRVDLTAPFTMKALADLQPGQVEVVVSNQAVDRQGESIKMSGIDTTQIMRNPVVLWAHDYSSLPIGKIDKLWKQSGNLMARITFMVDIVPFAKTVYDLIMAGALNAVSIGGIVKEYGVKAGVTDYTKIAALEMVELSVVPVGAHPDALVTSKSLEEIGLTKAILDHQWAEFKKSATLENKFDDMITNHIRVTKDLLSALESISDAPSDSDAEPVTRTVHRRKLVLSQKRHLAKGAKSQIETLISDLNTELKGIHNGLNRKD